MRFAQPWSLWLLAALAVPLVIHLRKSRGGRVVRVGSLRHLAGQDAMSRWVPRLQEWPLLLARLALLALFVLVLAEPYRPAGRTAGPASSAAIFVAPEVLDAAGRADPLLDSLRRAGSTVRLLAPGFPAVRLDSLTTEPGIGGGAVWSLVREALDSLDGAAEVLVIAPAEAGHYRGSRPVLPVPVRWHLVSAAPPRPWLVRAAAAGDSLHVVVAAVEGFQVREFSVTLPEAGAAAPLPGPGERYALSTAPGRWVRLLAADGPRPVAIDSLEAARLAPVRIGIASSADRAIEARYLSAALRAVAANGGVPVELSAVPAGQAPSPALDWLIWLSPAEPAEWSRALVEGGGTLLVESRLADAPLLPSGVVGEGALASLVAAAPGEVRRRGPLPESGGVLLSDGTGAPLLTGEAIGKGRRLTFASRFHPAWSPWAVGPALPALLAALLESPPVRDIDPRAMAPSQVATGAAAGGVNAAAGWPRSLTVPGIVLLLALWTLERLLAFRRARSAA